MVFGVFFLVFALVFVNAVCTTTCKGGGGSSDRQIVLGRSELHVHLGPWVAMGRAAGRRKEHPQPCSGALGCAGSCLQHPPHPEGLGHPINTHGAIFFLVCLVNHIQQD